MKKTDNTKEVLEQLLTELYAQQSKEETKGPKAKDSYLIAQDGQFLGRITKNRYDNESILNKYGPYGSRYSPTSVFNRYSVYGSQYGVHSLNNPYNTAPPKLYIKGKVIGVVSKNRYVSNRIPTEAFLYTLTNNLAALLAGKIIESEAEVRIQQNESFIEGGDGTFLGSLKPNQFDNDSIFNKFGPYGNQFSQTTIFNPYSMYGGQFSNLSPYNQFAGNPPKVYLNGKFIAYLTQNTTFSNRIDPDEIFNWATRNVSAY